MQVRLTSLSTGPQTDERTHTTDIHLPRRIGEALHRAYQLDFHYIEALRLGRETIGISQLFAWPRWLTQRHETSPGRALRIG